MAEKIHAELLPQFEKETHQFLIERMRILGTVGPVLYMSFSVLDYIRYPDQAGAFTILRVFTSLLILSAVFLSYSPWGRKHFVTITSLAVQISCHTISIMTAMVNGFEDIYFVGNVLIILLGAMFLPWRPGTTAVTGLLICGFYVVINLLYHPLSLSMATPLFFMLAAVIFSVISVIGLNMSRMRDLMAREEIKQAHDKIKKEINAARAIQRSLLPPFEQDFSSAKLQALYMPCEELSGDFFDTIRSGDYLYFYVADVTSHGTAAAQVTYLVKELFSQSLAHTPGIDLKPLFEWVCKRYSEMKLEYDLGLQLARFHLPSSELEYLRSNAPEAVRISNAQAQNLNLRPSTRISSFNSEVEIQVEVRKQKLNSKDSVYFYTDGASEFPTQDGRQFGERQFLRALLDANTGRWPESLVDQLNKFVRPEGFPDDITVLRLSVV